MPISASGDGSSTAQRRRVRTASMASSRDGRTRAGLASGLAMSFMAIPYCRLAEAGGFFVLVEAPRPLRAIERKGRDLDEEFFSLRRLHLVVADHQSRGRR